MGRVLASLLGVTLLATLGAGPIAAATRTAEVHAPKVAIIVGPVGSLTDEYRDDADQAAAEARRWTANVVRVYSPNATWPAVRSALQGASIVVYLGHGNGFPSPYRTTLAPGTEDGLGLNPVLGVDDDSHQYFGEATLAREVSLARHAVVLLSHLCYASGNSEPGRPEPTEEVAVARVDNYAAGWLAAGADAVIADSYGGLAPYVRELLTTNQTIRTIWSDQPGAHGNVATYASKRTPADPMLLDTDTSNSGYHRSLVGRLGLRGSDVRSGGATAPATAATDPTAEPTLVGSRITIAVPTLSGPPVAGSTSTLRIGLGKPRSVAVPNGIEVGLRWDPIDVPAADPNGPSPNTGSGTGAESGAGANPSTGTGGNGSGVAPAGPSLNLVEPETLGDVVAVTRAHQDSAGLRLDVHLPDSPGLYRLVVTLHDADGVAYDEATQALVHGLLVQVTAPTSAAILVQPTATVTVGDPLIVQTTVVNTGNTSWAMPELTDPRRPNGPRDAIAATLVGRLVPLGDGSADAPGSSIASLSLAMTPGAQSAATLTMVAPTAPGSYLLILDVIVPGTGSLIAAGNPPTFVTVVVVPAALNPGG